MSTRKAGGFIPNPHPKRSRKDRREDAVDTILDGLPKHLPPSHRDRLLDRSVRASVESKARDLITRLRAKVPSGRLGKNDSTEARAAVVLDHVFRKEDRTKHVPLDALSKPLGLSKKSVANLSKSLRHYVEDIDGSGGNRTTTRSVKAAAERGTFHRERSGQHIDEVKLKSVEAAVSNTIRELSISFGSMLKNPDGCARRAEALMEGIIESMMKDVFSRGDSLTDLEKNQEAYGAACFYLLAQSESSDKGKLQARAEELEDDELYEGQLTELDVIEARKLSKPLFRSIFKRVRDLSQSVRMDAGPSRKRKKIQEEYEATENKEGGAATHPAGADTINGEGHGNRSGFQPSEKFARWSVFVLNKAKEDAKLAIHNERGVTMEGISDGDALARAALDALRQHGY